jgi:flagellar hook protein FlgE
MGLTSALNTSLNGLSLNETMIDVLGNNIANAGTNGFKASHVRFQTQLSRTLSVGSAPTATDGGTNPRQIGLGASVSVISRDFTQGSIANSTNPSDLAIQGDGFFVLSGNNGVVYSRNGNFSLSSDNHLVNDQGYFVQGYSVDQSFNLVNTTLTSLTIPVGTLNIAQRTSDVVMAGALKSTGDVATQGSVLQSEQLIDASTAGNATAGTLLTNLQNIQNGTPTNLFTSGQTLSFAPQKGGKTVDPVTMTVTGSSTVGDLMTLINDAYGIVNTSGDANFPIPLDGVTGGTPGVSISGGRIQVLGNAGTVNDLALNVGDLLSNGTPVPLQFSKSQTANGESAGTDFVIYDSLGQAVQMRMTAVLESRASGQTNFRYYIESADDARPNVAISNGVVTFNGLGKVSGGGNSTFSLDRSNTAAVSPMQVNLDLTQLSGILGANAPSQLGLKFQDGAAPGTLQSFVVDESGVINGVFDNGLTRTLGQVVLARFPNPDGLIEAGSTTFKEGVSSGNAQLAAPGTLGAGTIRAGSIELSNTDIGKSLVDLIVASTNYRGNARVIASVQQLVDELLTLGR